LQFFSLEARGFERSSSLVRFLYSRKARPNNEFDGPVPVIRECWDLLRRNGLSAGESIEIERAAVGVG